MANEFDAVMLKRTDADLINILNSAAGDYQPAAMESAKREFERRNLSHDQITVATQVIENKQQRDAERANEPLGLIPKIVALLFRVCCYLFFRSPIKQTATFGRQKN